MLKVAKVFRNNIFFYYTNFYKLDLKWFSVLCVCKHQCHKISKP